MRNLLTVVVKDYGWIHTSLGVFGNIAFFVGSVLFLPRFEEYLVTGVWLFILGSGFMLIGAVGNLILKVYENDF